MSYQVQQPSYSDNMKDIIREKSLISSAIESLLNQQIAKEANQIFGKIADCLEKGQSISSKEVQQLIKKHCEFAGKFHEKHHLDRRPEAARRLWRFG